MSYRCLFLTLLAGLLWSAVPAFGQTAYIKRPGGTKEADNSVTPMLGASAEYGLEVGAKADVLLDTPGFVPSINNSVFLEGEAFVAAGHVFLAPLLRWDFNLHPQWTLYGEAGIEVILGSTEDEDGRVHSPVRPSFAPGAIWHIPGKSFYLRGEVDIAHGAARAGPMFLF